MWGQPPRLSRQAQRGVLLRASQHCHSSSSTVAWRLALLARAHHQNRHGRRSRPSLIFHRDRERLCLNCCRQQRIHHTRAPMRIGLEHSCRNRRAVNRNQPQLISLPRRQRWHVIRQEDQATAAPQIKCLALWLRRCLRRNQRHPLRFGIKDRRRNPTQLFQFAAALPCPRTHRRQTLLQRSILPPQRKREHHH